VGNKQLSMGKVTMQIVRQVIEIIATIKTLWRSHPYVERGLLLFIGTEKRKSWTTCFGLAASIGIKLELCSFLHYLFI
jgi:hypothetical protein